MKPFSSENKIYFLIKDLSPGGAEKVCVMLYNILIKKGLNITLVALNLKNKTLFNRLDENAKVIDINVNSVRKSIWPLLKIIIKNKPDLILSFHIEPCIVISILKNLLRLRTTIVLRSINTLSHAYNNPTRLIDKYLVFPLLKTQLQKMNLIIAQSTGMQEDLIMNFNISNQKIITIFNPSVLTSNNPSKLPKSPTGVEFTFIGRLETQKGLYDLIEIFDNVIRINSEVKLNILGTGSLYNDLQNIIRQRNLSRNIRLLGYTENVGPYIMKSKAVVLTSLYEGFPNVLVESIALGTPVISYDCPSGPSDIIINTVNGILVPYLDQAKFSKAVIKVVNNEIKFDRDIVLSTSERFQINDISKQYYDVLTCKYN
ncbi:glycosyltransferase [Saccharicrinis sp. FJH54]|uniref:glycosyltransferase n=1 Tax=Saccharicrinis sp. FJH54 TaxID=3344665 RepID=UPI0035D42985